MSTENFDREVVQSDAALLHALATRSLRTGDAELGDPVVMALALWVDWVDAGVDEEAVFDISMGKDRVVALHPRRHSRAALIAGSTIAALVVSSGAAAAVTGDPFLVAKAPLKAISSVNPFDHD